MVSSHPQRRNRADLTPVPSLSRHAMVRSGAGTAHWYKLAACVLATAAASVHGQVPREGQYPSKIVRLIEPFPPGGSTDLVARLLADRLAPRLGQPVVIDHRTGAGGAIGMEAAARAPADGYTLVVAPLGPWVVNPHLYELQYDTLNDLTIIIRLLGMPGLLIVHPSVPVRSVRDLIALARARPTELNYGSSGVGGWGHISAELFDMMAGTRMTHVPYRGSAAALSNLIGGQLHVLFNTASTTVPHVLAGTVRALATTGMRRMESLPNVPTVDEAGVPGYENTTWSAIGAPARTPASIIKRLNNEIAEILQFPDVQELARKQSSVTIGGTPEEAKKFLAEEFAKYGKIVKQANIRK